MYLRSSCIVGSLVLLAGCGGNPNPAPVANSANVPSANVPGSAPLAQPEPEVETGPPVPFAGRPDGAPVIAAKPAISAGPDLLPEVAQIEIDPSSNTDDLSQRFAQARTEMKQRPSGDFELEAMYSAATTAPYQGKNGIEDRIGFLKEWSTAKPEDPTPLIILARLYVRWGWEARGSGFVGTVSAEGYRLFEERLKQGAKYAQAAEKLQPKDPELYRTLVDLGKGLGAKREHVDRWVEAGRNICPNYFPLYEATVEYLLPRWHGEPGDCERFAEAICTAVGGDDGLEAYARIAMQTNCYDHDMLYTSEYDPQKIAAGSEIMGKRFPQARSILHFAALVAWKSQNQALAQSYLGRLRKMKPEMRHWGSQRRYEQYVTFCEGAPCPDVADELFWPFLHGTDDIAYLEEGHTLVTSPQAKYELVRLWDRTDLRRPKGAIPEFPDKVAELQGGGKQLLLAAGGSKDNTTVALALDNLEEPVVFKAPGQHLGGVLSPDGKTAATQRNSTVVLWDPKTGETLHELASDDSHTRLCFSPDGQRLMVATLKVNRIFDVLEGKQIGELPANQQTDGLHLSQFTGFFDSEVLLCRSLNGKGKMSLARWLSGENEAVEFLRIPPGRNLQIESISKRYLILEETGSEVPPLLHVHRMSDGKYLRTIQGHYGHLSKVLVSPDESELAVVEFGGPVRFWKLPPLGAN
jgi:hypothetical protein